MNAGRTDHAGKPLGDAAAGDAASPLAGVVHVPVCSRLQGDL